ncbi:MAG: hypothetical protein PHX49_07180 [Bacteroidales bacterium]|nr:hypothetical protein [Bacteroidales bacterium]
MSSRKGGTTPPSIRSLRTSRVPTSTSVRNSRARGPPRISVCGLRTASPASTIVGIRANCRLLPFGWVASAVTPCRPQAPDKESRAFAPR